MNPSDWNKKEWIKDVLSKSGTDLVEIKDEKPKERKMVYYPSLPLIIKSEQPERQQICTQLNGETHIYTIHPVTPIQQQLSPNQQQSPSSPQLHLMQSTTALNRSPQSSTTLLIPTNQNYLQNIKLEQHQQQQQQQNVQSQQPNSSSSNTVVSNKRGPKPGSRQTGAPAPKPQFKCDQCNMIFGSKSAHTSHVKSHKKQTDNNFSSNGLSAHISMPTNLVENHIQPNAISQVSSTGGGSDPYQCNVCQKTFAVPARLIRHYRTHTGERPFECEFCHKMFSVKENLQVHRRIHTKERPYKCEVCGRAFEHSGKLHRHMRIHTGERPHKCSVCSKTFIQSGQLVIHMRTHTGEKPYKCPVEGCGKGFTCSKQLKVHSRTHTGEKPYHCDICFRDFGYNHVLKLHKVQHYGSKCYKCTICEETFKSKKEMEAHIKGHANEIPDDDDETTTSVATDSSSSMHQNIKQETLNGFQTNASNRMESNLQQIETDKNRDTISITPIHHIPSSQTIQHQQPQHLTPPPPTQPHLVDNIPMDTELNGGIYDSVYQRFEQAATFNTTNDHPTINPALLAAATIASRRIEESTARNHRIPSPSPPPASLSNESAENSNEESMNDVHEYYRRNARNTRVENERQLDRYSPVPPHYAFESLDVLRQRGYFAPAPVAEFKPSLRHKEIVRQVEAAIAGVGLSPPHSSSTDSPERSSSPESDTMMMADRDVMTLPLRKRKLYMNENQTGKDNGNGAPTAVRMNSVIQFAKAS